MSRPILFSYDKLRKFYMEPRELTAAEEKEIEQVWKTRIKRKEYDAREEIQELRAILDDTSCIECAPQLNYAHTTTSHRQYQQEQEQERQAQQVLDEAQQAIDEYEPTKFATTSIPRNHQELQQKIQEFEILAEEFSK